MYFCTLNGSNFTPFYMICYYIQLILSFYIAICAMQYSSPKKKEKQNTSVRSDILLLGNFFLLRVTFFNFTWENIGDTIHIIAPWSLFRQRVVQMTKLNMDKVLKYGW